MTEAGAGERPAAVAADAGPLPEAAKERQSCDGKNQDGQAAPPRGVTKAQLDSRGIAAEAIPILAPPPLQAQQISRGNADRLRAHYCGLHHGPRGSYPRDGLPLVPAAGGGPHRVKHTSRIRPRPTPSFSPRLGPLLPLQLQE